MNWLWKYAEGRQREMALKRSIEGQLTACIRQGVGSDFQRGYVCALYWSWKAAGYPDTAASIAAEALVTAGMIGGLTPSDDEAAA